MGSEVKHGLLRVALPARNPKKLPPEGWGPLNKGLRYHWNRKTNVVRRFGQESPFMPRLTSGSKLKHLFLDATVSR